MSDVIPLTIAAVIWSPVVVFVVALIVGVARLPKEGLGK